MNREELEKKLNNDIVVRQHFVPRCYLDAWTNDEKKLLCIDNDNKKSFTPKVEGIANVRYFYETKVLSPQQLDFLYKLWVDDVAEPFLKDALMGWLRVFAQKDIFQTFCKEKGWNVASEWFLKNTEEKMFAHIEGSIPEWRSHIEIFDASYWDDDHLFMFILWLMLQFIRTPQMQKNYLSNFVGTEYEELGQNTQNVFRWLFATRTAHNIIFSKDMKIVRLKNETDEKFITSDQPVVNVCASYKNIGELGYYDLELYYPITPNKAILVTPKNCYSPWQEINLTELQVKQYNIALEKLSERFIFKAI